jgi:hypothetical protein
MTVLYDGPENYLDWSWEPAAIPSYYSYDWVPSLRFFVNISILSARFLIEMKMRRSSTHIFQVESTTSFCKIYASHRLSPHIHPRVYRLMGSGKGTVATVIHFVQPNKPCPRFSGYSAIIYIPPAKLLLC